MNNLTAGFEEDLTPVQGFASVMDASVIPSGAVRVAPEAGSTPARVRVSKGSIRTLPEEILYGREVVRRFFIPNAAQTTTQEKSTPAFPSNTSEPASFLTYARCTVNLKRPYP